MPRLEGSEGGQSGSDHVIFYEDRMDLSLNVFEQILDLMRQRGFF